MKKIISALLAASLLIPGAAFADGGMEEILVSVKDKVSVPDNLTDFNTDYSTDENGITTYYFSWTAKDGNESMNVETDSYGNISSYSRYNSDWYDDDYSIKIDKGFNIDDVTAVSDSLMERLVPTLFEYDTDRLVRVPYEEELDIHSNTRYTIRYIRKYHGVEVKNNDAYVAVTKTKDGFIADNASINWDYTKEYVPVPDNYEAMDISQAEKALSKAVPLELQYRKSYDDKYFLEYTKNGNFYIDAASGEEVKESEKEIIPYNMAKQEDASASGGSGSSLTPAERTELENIAGLKSTDELFSSMLSMSELGIKKDIDKSKLRSSTQKADEDFFTSLYIPENEEESSQINACFNASTGEMISFNRYSDNHYEKENGENPTAVYDFFNKYYSDKLKQCDTGKSVYTRLINNIPYINNTLSAEWNSKENRIDSFNISWDKDISEIPAPENIVSAEDAEENMYKLYPPKLMYIISDSSEDMYTLVYTQNTYDIRINAFDGQPVNIYSDKKDRSYYDDIGSHWIKNIADTLCDYGIRLEGKSLNPDEQITQGDFLKLVYSGVCGYYIPDSDTPVYRAMLRRKILTDEEVNSKEPITRETAICYLLRAMGIKEVAELEGIYVCGFDDSGSISKDKYGYCAIAKGFGIVKGFDNKLCPTENITRAEALTMVYNYLTR